MSDIKCTIEGCNNTKAGRGLCQMHYRRLSLYGDPHYVRRVQRSPYDASKITLCDDYALVELTQGKVAQIDIADVEKVRQYNWNYSSSTGYAYSSKVGTSMQQFLIGRAPSGMEIDHDDRDKLNNRRSNIAHKTHSENCRNSERSDNGGVSYHKYSGKYQAYGIANGKQVYLGLAETSVEAHGKVASWKLMRERGKDDVAKAEE